MGAVTVLAIIAFVVLGFIGIMLDAFGLSFGIGLVGVVLVLLFEIISKLNNLNSRLDEIEKKLGNKDEEKE